MDPQLSILAVSFLVTLGFAVQSIYQCWGLRDKSKSQIITKRSARGIRTRVAIAKPSSYPPAFISYTALSILLFAIGISLYPSMVAQSHDFVDMGFGVIHPIDQCVRGETANTMKMSMEFICTDRDTVEMRMYQDS